LTLPVHSTAPSGAPEKLRTGIALCLSGGGYRAMLFHVGSLWRLNEAGVLPQLDRVSSVSGGSITAGVLAMNWRGLAIAPDTGVAANFNQCLVDPIRQVAARTIDEGSIVGGIFLPGSIADKVTAAYEKYLFGGKKLADLPRDDEGPRFVINATNVMTGAVWRFSRPYMGDWRVGLTLNPDCKLSVAVAASSAFPPVLSPLTLNLDPAKVTKTTGADLHDLPYTDTAILSDGGVYDNLGLETTFKEYKTLFVSDAGQKMSAEPEPKHDWAQHSIRVMSLLDNQVRNLRKRQLIAAYQRQGPDGRTGAYWSIRSAFADFTRGASLSDPLGLAQFDPTDLAAVRTRLKRLDPDVQQKLINWGYAICDTALRRHAQAALQTAGVAIRDPAGLPFPNAGL
jgi:NTE family protein